ncbi:MAG TPA: NTP transferase domain-containing protein [Polyangia bacterium]
MITQAIILAAGRGQRLNGHEVPKPLAMVGGMPLLRRTLRALAQNGVRDVGIVIGYRGDEIRAAFPEGEPGQRLTWIENPEWEKPNGVSVLAARFFLKGRSFLLMSDHVFCPDVLSPLTRLDARGEGALLVVDPDIPRCFDLADATKVRRNGELIVDIGKEIDDYDAIDTGIFVVSPALMSELGRLESPSLSDGVRALCRRGLMRAHDIGGRLWQDVDTPETKHHTEWLLRAYGPELRGSLPLDSDSAVTLRLDSHAAATACAETLRARGVAATVVGPHGHGYCVRVSAPAGVADPELLQTALRAVASAASASALRAVHN